MNRSMKILIAEDTDSMREAMVQILQKEGHSIVAASSGREALDLLHDQYFEMVITDYKMGDISGLDVLKAVRERSADAIVLVITAYGTIELAVEMIKAGAWDFMTKPFSKEALNLKVGRAGNEIEDRIRSHRLMDENAYLRDEINSQFNAGEIIGRSSEIQALFTTIKKMSASDSAVFISGESGTGKELVARAVHQNSSRSQEPFIRVNCGALAEGVLESELFGHEKGSFTGALRQKKGRFELAHKGTLFLDEIGDIPLNTQVKLLRVIQEKEFERVGGEETLKVDVRIISATHRDLPEYIKTGQFREDLYYRLHILPVHLPPLRQRKEDIPVLVRHFLNRMTRERGLPEYEISKEAIRILTDYPWPGNVRELENAMERIMVLTDKPRIDADILDFLNPVQFGTEIAKTSWNLEANLAAVERDLLEKAIQKTQGNKARAARLLGLKEGALYYKLEKYGLLQKE